MMLHATNHWKPAFAPVYTETRRQLRIPRRVPWESRTKRLFDCVVGTIALIVALPVMAVVALAVFLEDRGPIIFKARRVGRDGREFNLYKFRSMTIDAEKRLAALSHLNAGGPYMIRIPHDPRVTKVGKLLRRTALDELPQIFNVLRGEMSLVGPRPQAPREVALYTPHERQRLRAVPGITGLWQVSARHENDFAQWVALDLEYQRHWSLWLDLGIMLRTPMAVARGTSTERKDPRGVRGRARSRPTTNSAWEGWHKWVPMQPIEEQE